MLFLIGTLIALVLALVVTVQALAHDRDKRQHKALMDHQAREKATQAHFRQSMTNAASDDQRDLLIDHFLHGQGEYKYHR